MDKTLANCDEERMSELDISHWKTICQSLFLKGVLASDGLICAARPSAMCHTVYEAGQLAPRLESKDRLYSQRAKWLPREFPLALASHRVNLFRETGAFSERSIMSGSIGGAMGA